MSVSIKSDFLRNFLRPACCMLLIKPFAMVWALFENAVLGWGDDKIGEKMGMNSPTLEQAIDFFFKWGIPTLLSGITIWFIFCIALYYGRKTTPSSNNVDDINIIPTTQSPVRSGRNTQLSSHPHDVPKKLGIIDNLLVILRDNFIPEIAEGRRLHDCLDNYIQERRINDHLVELRKYELLCRSNHEKILDISRRNHHFEDMVSLLDQTSYDGDLFHYIKLLEGANHSLKEILEYNPRYFYKQLLHLHIRGFDEAVRKLKKWVEDTQKSALSFRRELEAIK